MINIQFNTICGYCEQLDIYSSFNINRMFDGNSTNMVNTSQIIEFKDRIGYWEKSSPH